MNLLISVFSKVEDRRIERKKLYPLLEIIVVSIVTMLCGGETYEDMRDCGLKKLNFLRKILPFKNGIPSVDTFERVFSLMSPKQFHDCFAEWVSEVKKN